MFFFCPLVQCRFSHDPHRASPSERIAGVSSRSITVTNKSNSLTYTVASSLVCTSPLAVTVVRFFDILMVSNSAELRSFLLTILHACSGIYRKLSFRRFFGGCGRQTQLIGRRIECSFVLFYELVNISGKVPCLAAGASLFVFQSLLEICSPISWRRDCADEEV